MFVNLVGTMQSLSSTISQSPNSVASLCPNGRWMEVSQASAYLSIKNIKQMKAFGVPYLAFERGVSGKGPQEYWSHEYVYCLLDAPDDWVAVNEYDVSLADWCKLCHYFSDNQQKMSPSEYFTTLFEKYTGCKATASNIDLAFSSNNVMVSPTALPTKKKKTIVTPPKTKSKQVLNKEKAVKARKVVLCRGIQSEVLNQYAEKNSNYAINAGWEYFDGSWRSKLCMLNKEIDTNQRCTSCGSASKHLLKSRHPMLFNLDDTTNNECTLLPDDNDIRNFLSEHVSSITAEDIPNSPMLAKVASIMKLKSNDRIEFGKKQMMLVCGSCDQHRICNKRKNLNSMCRNCQKKEVKEKKRDKDRKDNYDQRVDPTSKIRYGYLTPKERSARLKKANNKRRVISKAEKRLRNQFEIKNQQHELSEGMAKQYKIAMEAALTTNSDALRGTLKDLLFKVMQKQAKSGKKDYELDMEQCQDFISYVEESMKNMIHTLKGQKNRCRYSPKLMALSMSLYLKAGPSAYKQYEEDNIVVMPDVTTLAEIRQQQDIKDGYCVSQYEIQLLMRQTKLEIGQIMCDEMKLQKDVVINVKNGKIEGFSKDFVDMKKLMNNLIDGEKIDSFTKPATHVNQWRYRSTDGRSYNCEFWFNYGSLTGDTLLRQFNQVVMHCESVGSIVLGMVCDAGGNNARLFKLLRGREVLNEGAWLDEEMVRTENPYDPTRYIYMYHCSTHDLKAMRNALFTSWTVKGKKGEGKKKFRDVDDTPIGKDVVYNSFVRDQERKARGCKPMSDVQESTVNLTRWSVMNAQETKRVFSPRTLTEILTHIYTCLGVEKEDMLCRSEYGSIGYFSAAAKHVKEILKNHIDNERLKVSLASDISGFEWLANVHEIFNARLMKMDEMIHFGNIEIYEAQVKKNLSYFASLRVRQLQRKASKEVGWEKTFLDYGKTWTNIRITCRGFFLYCRSVIKHADLLKDSIPRFIALSPAHSNTSVLECNFSMARKDKAEDARSYKAFVANRFMAKVTALNNNKMYCSESVGCLYIGKEIGPRQMIKFIAKRKGLMNNLINKYTEQKTHIDYRTKAFSADTTNAIIQSTLGAVEKGVLSRLVQRTLPTSYATLLLKEDSFQQSMRLSIGTPMILWFQHFLEDTMEKGCSEIFDDACRQLQNKFFEMTLKSFQKRNSDSYSFEFGLHEFHRSELFAEMCWGSMPGRLADDHAQCSILCTVLAEIHLRWVKEALRQDRRTRNPELFYPVAAHSLTVAEQNNEVNSFVGYAVFSCLELINKEVLCAEEKEDSEKMIRLKQCITILDSMRIRECDVDEEYMSKYYDTNMYLYNEGGLTLIQKHFFEWAKQLMTNIRLTFTENTINIDPHNCFGIAERVVMSDKSIRSTFISLCSNHSSTNNIKAMNNVYDMFVPKATHARFAVVFRQWKEKNCSKLGDVALRTKLKAGTKKDAAKERRDDTEQSTKKCKTQPSPEHVVVLPN